MFILAYTIFGTLLLLIVTPFLFIFLPFNEVLQRLGLIKPPKFQNALWFHAASVGEANAVKPLLIALKQQQPSYSIVVTTMTSTGLNTVKSIKEVDYSTIIPFDLLLLLIPFIKRINPKAIFIVETELWPALLYSAKSQKIPVAIINGRISDRSVSRYQFLLPLLRSFFMSVKLVGAQSDLDVNRFKELDFKTVVNTHNLKFSLNLPEQNRDADRQEWSIAEDDFVIVWGSSRPGEEGIIRAILPNLQERIQKLKIIIAPRHLNRLAEVQEIFKDKKLTLLSEVKADYDVMIIDSLGILCRAYSLADIAIVGGSFENFGGHNPLEPAFYSIPTIIGNYHSSCRQVVKELKDNGGIVVSDKETLLDEILRLYDSPIEREHLGTNGKKTLEQNHHTLDENISLIQRVLSD
ncbi:MAG: glycosyltransferase N-terminal domain-containing protein [Candidatus Cloacimonadia bacterium]